MESPLHSVGKVDRLAWLGLRLIPGVGSVSFGRLVERFGSPEAALGAPRGALRQVPRLPAETLEAVHRREFTSDPARELERLEELGARMLLLCDPDYPEPLRQIFAPPPVLFMLGDLGPAAQGGVAVVGSRQCTAYGLKVAHELGRALGQTGMSAVSGLALGVDTAAHRGALEVDGHTVGVLGCGLNVVYPPANRELTRTMAQRGAVLSEFPLDTQPVPRNFPVRNRIISGLSRAVLVVEAGLKSGSLITARHALEQGREVFAVPGPLGQALSTGCNQLIKDGARLYTGPADILGPAALPPSPAERPRPAAPPPDLKPDAIQLLELLGPAPAHIDLLVRQSGLEAGRVAHLLIELEMEGLVTDAGARHYQRNP